MTYKSSLSWWVPAMAVSAALVLTACSSESDGDVGEIPEFSQTDVISGDEPSLSTTVVTETVVPSEATTPEEPVVDDAACSDMTGVQAVGRAVELMPPPEQEGVSWEPGLADLGTYDPCLPLSWIVLGTGAPSVAGPYQIALFHEGEYLGTATKEPRAYSPDVSRVADNAISVEYTYLLPGEGSVEASGRTVAEFSWDDSSESVVMAGEASPLS